MDDEQCNFEELTAILDESDNEVDENTPAKVLCEDQKDNMESSDDDIDEDELDLLAALVEEDQGDAKPPPSASKIAEQEKNVPVSLRNACSDEKDEEAKISQVKEMKQEDKPCASEIKKEPAHPSIDVKQEQNTLDPGFCDKLDELKAMQEKIRKLEEDIRRQAAGGAKAEAKEDHVPPSYNKPITPTNNKKVTATNSLSTKSKTPKAKENKSVKPPSNISLLEEDIFSRETESSQSYNPVKKPIKKQSQSPSRAKKNITDPQQHSTKSADSDSDWEDMEGQKPSNLTKEGQEIKKLIKQGPRDRVAHSSEYDPKDLDKLRKNPWQAKSGSSFYKPNASTASPSQPKPSGSNKLSSQVQRDDSERFGGIRIINPLVSGSQFHSLMESRKLIRISRLHTQVKTPDVESDWVTVGVVVSKTDAKKSQKGNQYSIWRLSDLDDCDKTVNFFLFNKVFQEHWKTLTGSVIGLLNPSILQNTEKSSADEVSITIDNPKKMLSLGRSRDLGHCKSKTKAGKDCSNFVNVQTGDHCTYHVKAAYKKHGNKRTELQAGYTGVVPKTFEKALFKKGAMVIYGGHSYSTTGREQVGVHKKKSISINSLLHHQSTKQPELRTKVSTLQLHDLLPEDKAKLEANERQKKMAEKHDKFHEALTVPTAGAMNFVKHLKTSELVTEKEKSSGKSMISVSAKDLLKKHTAELTAKRQAFQMKPKDLSPAIGRGFAPGDDLLFDLDDPGAAPPLMKNLKADQAKNKAISLMKSKGGLSKQDPNALKKVKSPEQQERVKKRMIEAIKDSAGEGSSSGENEPPKKKSRMVGGLDLNSPEVQKLLNAKSKHDGALTEQEQEKQDMYFDVLEKKEAMEEKMKKITEVQCKAFTCKQCKYTALSTKPECKSDGHTIISHKATKKFFKCKECDHRTITIQKFPVNACKKCGGHSFLRCSMFKEKKGPKLPSEELKLRGDEIKFLNQLS